MARGEASAFLDRRDQLEAEPERAATARGLHTRNLVFIGEVAEEGATPGDSSARPAAAPGGGWDQTARSMQQVMVAAGLVTFGRGFAVRREELLARGAEEHGRRRREGFAHLDEGDFQRIAVEAAVAGRAGASIFLNRCRAGRQAPGVARAP